MNNPIKITNTPDGYIIDAIPNVVFPHVHMKGVSRRHTQEILKANNIASGITKWAEGPYDNGWSTWFATCKPHLTSIKPVQGRELCVYDDEVPVIEAMRLEDTIGWLCSLHKTRGIWHMDDRPHDVFDHTENDEVEQIDINDLLETQQTVALAICKQNDVDIHELCMMVKDGVWA